MADAAKRYGPLSIGNTETTLITVPAVTQAIVKWVRIANTSASAVTVKMSVGADAAGTRLLPDLSIAANDILELSEQFLVLEAAETLRATGSTNNTLTFTAGAVLIT